MSADMLVQEMVIDNDTTEIGMQDAIVQFTPIQKLSKSDVPFPMTTPRKRAPSVVSIASIVDQAGQSMGRLTVLATAHSSVHEPEEDDRMQTDTPMALQDDSCQPQLCIHDLPLEVQGKVLDYIFGDMHSVHAGSTSLRGKSVSSLMRHPRRKAVSDLALVSTCWRELVQERIYRHLKIKGTRAGLAESENWFYSHWHLTRHVRHIEFWVPVWGEKASLDNRSMESVLPLPGRNGYHHLAHQANESLMTANDLLGFNFKLSVYSATLSQIFTHINVFFPEARVFTLEGGHCKKSNMIRQFPNVLFSNPNQALDPLPNIRTFAMRGAWNIMREYSHWRNIELALPNVEEWHCGYAKPRVEADATINEILLRLPQRLRHVNISLDGMYSKDPTTLGSSSMPGLPHLCERLGRVLPQLESLAFTGKICECLWTSAIDALAHAKEEPRLKGLEIVVKSCCRQRVTGLDPETGETIVHELGGVMADGAGITNLVFIRAFERLVLHTVGALKDFPHLEHVRIRFIDLDSPCTLLNPYWQLERKKVYGIWSEEIVERLAEVRPDIQYEELSDGIESGDYMKDSADTVAGEAGAGAGTSLYPKWKPRSIKTSSYKLVADTRGS